MLEPSPQLKKLQQKGRRLTRIRKAVFALLEKEQRPLSVPEIVRMLAGANFHTHKTTVYRQLELLLNEHLIETVDFGDRKKRYELASTKHHHHLVCIRCDDVRDVTLKKDLRAQEQHIAKVEHFRILRHSLEFFGLCLSCSKK